MLFIILFCICFFILINFYFNYENNDVLNKNLNEDNLIKIKEYKIKNKKKEEINDKFNIKEYNYINNDIIIHNKYKNELLDNLENKYKNEKINQIKEDKKKQELYIKIKENSEVVLLNNLKSKISNILNEIKSLKLLLEMDIANLLTDIKLNKISYNEKINLKNNIIIEINNINNEIKEYEKLINSNNNDYKKLIYIYIKGLNKKLKFYYKKQKIYNKIL